MTAAEPGRGSVPAAPTVWLGVDAGGSTTRAVVIDGDAAVLGRGRSAGANVTSDRPDVIRAHLAEAISTALTGLGDHVLRSACFGLAGLAPDRHVEMAELALGVLAAMGLRPSVAVCSDAEVAFAAGTSASAGCVLIAGTGAVAAAIVDGRERRTVDGHGWLLGDDGSGYWLGHQALRAVLRGLDGRGPRPSFEADVLGSLDMRAYDDPGRTCWAVIDRVRGLGAAPIARLAAVVIAHHASDATARALVDDASCRLVETLLTLRPAADTAVVLSGSLLTNDTALSRTVVDRLEVSGLTSVSFGTDGALGAARLARHGRGSVGSEREPSPPDNRLSTDDLRAYEGQTANVSGSMAEPEVDERSGSTDD